MKFYYSNFTITLYLFFQSVYSIRLQVESNIASKILAIIIDFASIFEGLL